MNETAILGRYTYQGLFLTSYSESTRERGHVHDIKIVCSIYSDMWYARMCTHLSSNKFYLTWPFILIAWGVNEISSWTPFMLTLKYFIALHRQYFLHYVLHSIARLRVVVLRTASAEIRSETIRLYVRICLLLDLSANTHGGLAGRWYKSMPINGRLNLETCFEWSESSWNKTPCMLFTTMVNSSMYFLHDSCAVTFSNMCCFCLLAFPVFVYIEPYKSTSQTNAQCNVNHL